MLDNSVTRAGTLLYKGGKIYIDGWELKEGGMCREHVIFACLYVAQELMKAASANIAEPGGAENTCADMPADTPREWLCPESRAFDAMFDEPDDDPMRPTIFGGAPAAVVDAIAEAVVKKTDAEVMGLCQPPGEAALTIELRTLDDVRAMLCLLNDAKHDQALHPGQDPVDEAARRLYLKLIGPVCDAIRRLTDEQTGSPAASPHVHKWHTADGERWECACGESKGDGQ